jgi:hypothetical protein
MSLDFRNIKKQRERERHRDRWTNGKPEDLTTIMGIKNTLQFIYIGLEIHFIQSFMVYTAVYQQQETERGVNKHSV